MKRKLVCIVCPRGCLIEADVSEQGVEISGNGCPKGAAYAKEECTAPVRTVTSAVRVAGGREAMVIVKTAKPVPKDKIFEVMRLIRAKTVEPPVSAGDVIISGVFGTDIIATKSVE